MSNLVIHNPVEWTGNIQVHHPVKAEEPNVGIYFANLLAKAGHPLSPEERAKWEGQFPGHWERVS